jgi:predicted AlkP superfamily phosphohydrolase/phosphomutase
VIEQLARDYPWEVFVCAFEETHRAGHYFWTERATGRPLEGLKEVAKAVDAAVARLRALLGEEDLLAVFSLHGMGECYDIDRFAEPMWDYFDPAPPSPNRRFNPVRIANRALPRGLRRRISAAFSTRARDRLLAHYLTAGRDWSKTRVIFPIPDGRVFARLNLAGREARGIVAPGEAERELQRLESGFGGARTAGGEPVFATITRLHDRFSGPRLPLLPDLAAQIHPRPIGDVIQMGEGRELRAPWRNGRDGDHRPEGFYIIRGPGSRAGAEGPAIRGQDLARHVLGLAGITV